MKPEYTRDVVVIMASLFGIIAGHELRQLHISPASPAEGMPPHGTQSPEARHASAPPDPLIGVSSLFAASTLTLRVGEHLRVPQDNLAAEAALAFGVAAGLTYFTDALRRYIPGLKG
jgi:hypothetical protein